MVIIACIIETVTNLGSLLNNKYGVVDSILKFFTNLGRLIGKEML